MSDNLLKIIDYMYDNFRFGSKLEESKLEDLYHQYPIRDAEKVEVENELKSLQIEIIHSKIYRTEMIKAIIKELDEENELDDELVTDEEGYLDIDMSSEEFDFIDDLDEGDLDSIIEDEKFIHELSTLKDVVDKKHNIEYLIDYTSSESSDEKKLEALEKIVLANEKLVWSIVFKYKKNATTSFDIDDMFQSGVKGLLKAAERFDVSLDNQFSTYAVWWIRQAITRDIGDYSMTIRVPIHMQEKTRKYIRSQNQFWKNNERVASKEEIAQIMQVTIEEIDRLEFCSAVGNLPSLDMPVGEDGSTSLGELINDDKHKSPEELAYETALEEELKDILHKRLNPRELRVIEHRFGFNNGIPQTLEEIGKEEKVTRERIRQIEAKALRKLRCNYKITGRLKDFYYD